MNIKVLNIVLCLFLCCNLSAQWHVGGKVAVNFSNLTGGDRADHLKQRIGFNMGAAGEYRINRWLALQGELLLAQYHIKSDNTLLDLEQFDDGSHVIKNASIRSYYIDVPLLVKFSPFKTVQGLNLEVGIQPGFFLNERISDGKQTYRQTNLYERNKVNCSFVFGLNFTFPANWYFDARYICGITDNYQFYHGMHTQAVQLSLGYWFNI